MIIIITDIHIGCQFQNINRNMNYIIFSQDIFMKLRYIMLHKDHHFHCRVPIQERLRIRVIISKKITISHYILKESQNTDKALASVLLAIPNIKSSLSGLFDSTISSLSENDDWLINFIWGWKNVWWGSYHTE